MTAASAPVRPPLSRRWEGGPRPLSFAEQRLWFLQQLLPDSPYYNVPCATRIVGPLDVDALRRSLAAVVSRHDPLRTRYPAWHGLPIALAGDPHEVALAVDDLSDVAPGARDETLRRILRVEAQRVFDLATGPVTRFRLVRWGPYDHVFMIFVHHIAFDAWSAGIFVRDLGEAYLASVAGRPALPSDLAIRYADFAMWQREWLESGGSGASMAYWERRLDGAPQGVVLPCDHARPAQQTFRGETLAFPLDRRLVEGLRAFERSHRCTRFMVVLAVLQAQLARYSGQDDLVVGVPIANRTQPEVEDLIGFLANTLPLRAQLGGRPSFLEHLARTRQAAVEAFAHQDVPFERIVRDLRPERDASHTPLFQVMCTVQNTPMPAQVIGPLRMEPVDVDNGSSIFDLRLHLLGPRCWLEYSTDLFERATAERLAGHFLNLLESAVAGPERLVGALPMLGGAERGWLVAWNRTDTADTADRRVHDAIVEQARMRPDAPAVTWEGEHVTYRELVDTAGRLAARLRRLGVGPEVRVGVCLERSPELVIALLGVLLAGGAYVPLDPSLPAERLSFMIGQAGISVVVAAEATAAAAPGATVRVDVLDWRSETPDPGDAAIAPDCLAYVMFTSGSTGQPKGAAVTHRAIVNRLTWMQGAFHLEPGDAVLQKTPFGFDVSVWEFFWPLMTGGRLVLARPGGHRDPDYLAALIRAERVTVLHFVPSMLSAFLEHAPAAELESVRLVISSGESLPAGVVERLPASFRRARLVNLYGPTEAAIDVSRWDCDRDGGPGVPIGRPIDNVRLHVLDPEMGPAPVGAVGELHIGGVALARGYVGRPDLTAERFVPDPHGVRPGERLYRTGDLARWTPDGFLEYIGRLDEQVKLHGFRIELGEVEAALRRHPGVRESAVVCVPHAGESRRLVGLVTLAGGDEAAFERPATAGDAVGRWREVFDRTYSEAGTGDPALELAGWNSSVTGSPIPEADMREWVDATVRRILRLRPQRVLEIGCGTGMLVARIAPRCESYVATDVSPEALAHVRDRLRPALGSAVRVELREVPADDLGGVRGERFDLVILNSVVQYFPSAGYAWSVLARAAAHLAPGGSIFVGDVRNLLVLEPFHCEVEVLRAPDDMPAQDVLHAAVDRSRRETELLLAPAFFTEAAAELDAGGCSVEVKRGRAGTEMHRFRYDVVLGPGAAREAVLPTAAVPGADRASIGRVLAAHPRGVRLLNLPNRRVLAAVRLAGLLRERGRDAGLTAGTVRGLHEGWSRLGVEPEDVHDLASERGMEAVASWAAGRPDGSFDAVLLPTEGRP